MPMVRVSNGGTSEIIPFTPTGGSSQSRIIGTNFEIDKIYIVSVIYGNVVYLSSGATLIAMSYGQRGTEITTTLAFKATSNQVSVNSVYVYAGAFKVE